MSLFGRLGSALGVSPDTAFSGAAALGNGVLSLGGSLGSGLFGASAQSAANAANLKIAQQNNLFNHYEAELNRNWLQYMSNSAYQRQRADLKAAGYNPLLGLSSPSSTPSGSTASASGLPSISAVNPMSGLSALGSAFTSALGAWNILKENERADKITDAQVKNIGTQTTKDKVQTFTGVVDKAITLGSAGASAYAAKKSAEVAKEAIKQGFTKESAKAFAKDMVGKSPSTSAVSSASVFGKVLSMFLPASLLGVGIGADLKTKEKMSDKDWKEWTNIRATSPY